MDKIKELYESLKPWFHNIILPDGTATNPEHPNNPQYIWDSFKDKLPPLSNKKVLDIGCNGGFFEIQLDALCKSLTAIDFNPLYIQQTKAIKEMFGLKCNVEQQNVEELSMRFKSAEFDVVFLLGVIYHVENPLRTLQQALRVTKELLIIESAVSAAADNRWDFNNYVAPDYNMWLPSASGLRKLIEYCGGEVIEYYERDNCPTRWIAFVRPKEAAL